MFIYFFFAFNVKNAFAFLVCSCLSPGPCWRWASYLRIITSVPNGKGVREKVHKVLGKYTSDLLILPDFFLEWTSGSRCEGHIKKKNTTT